jgi:hypothetical protein
MAGEGPEEGGDALTETRQDAYLAVIGADLDGSPQGER